MSEKGVCAGEGARIETERYRLMQAAAVLDCLIFTLEFERELIPEGHPTLNNGAYAAVAEVVCGLVNQVVRNLEGAGEHTHQSEVSP